MGLLRGVPICPQDLYKLFDPSFLGFIQPFIQLPQNHLVSYLGLPYSYGKGYENVHSPNGKRPRGDHWIEIFSRLMYQISMFLALETLLYKIQAVHLEGWPIVVGPQNSSGHGPFFGMQATYTLMQFLEDIVSLVSIKALKLR